MADESCGTCRYWSKIDWPDKRINDEGHCRRYPPQVFGGPAPSRQDGVFRAESNVLHGVMPPITIAANWCGEWQGKPVEQPDDGMANDLSWRCPAELDRLIFEYRNASTTEAGNWLGAIHLYLQATVREWKM